MRINTNLSSLQAQRSLSANNGDLSTRLQRLSTGLKINTGKDGPAALIASENMRSEIAGIRQAIDNSARATNVINTAEGSLAEVSSLLIEVQSLTNEAANTGALSRAEIEANQLQVDAILDSINRISNTTQFNGRLLLNGQLDYQTDNVDPLQIVDVKVNSAKLPDNAGVQVAVQVTGEAQLAEIVFAQPTTDAGNTTVEIGGNRGVEQLSFSDSTPIDSVALAINNVTDATGVTAEVVGTDLVLRSTDYGSRAFVSVQPISGTFATSANKANGVDTQLNINGSTADADGLVAKARVGGLDVELDLAADFATQTAVSATFDIVSGGTRFQVGSTVQRQSQVEVGIASVATSRLGSNKEGFLSQIASGGVFSLVGGNTTQAQRILDEAISSVATLRGRLGALQKNVLETNMNSLKVAMENVTAAESDIRDADFALETAALTRAQILSSANTNILAQANAQPQQVLNLLQ